jgi:hypothetical protein
MDITLSEIHERLSHIWKRVEVQGGEMSREQEEKINSLNLARDIKIAHVATMIKGAKGVISSLEKERDELERKKRSAEQQLSTLTRYLSKLVGERNDFECGGVKLTWETRQEIAVDEDALPERYFVDRIVRSIDSKMLKEKLQQGEQIPGATLIESRHLVVS